MDTFEIKVGDRVGLLSLSGLTHVTVIAVDNERKTIDFRADDGFEHWAPMSMLF